MDMKPGLDMLVTAVGVTWAVTYYVVKWIAEAARGEE